MASIVTYADGLRRIEFSLAANGPRQFIRLGRTNAKDAEFFCARVEAMIADRLQNRPHDAELSGWLGKLDEKWLARLRAVGLADGVGVSQTTLGDFLNRFFATLTCKPATRTFYSHTRRNLETHFGAARLLGSIKPADADGWRAHLIEKEKLSSATVARRVIAARTFWSRAVRWKLATENPFEGIKAGHQSNEARKMFVPRSVVDSVIAATADLEWRAIIALARYGGFRTPSETFALRWGDIDWERGTIRVSVPKLAHIEKCAQRIIPLFPELREPLLKLFAEAPEGAEYVITRHRRDGANLRTQFERIIDRAGVKAWPKLFHNLRASRETELMREYDLATVCKWIGNSPAVAAQHYATSVDLDADFQRAAAKGPNDAQQKAQQRAQQSAAERGCQRETAEPADNAKTLENTGFVACGQASSTSDKTEGWALQDSNL